MLLLFVCMCKSIPLYSLKKNKGKKTVKLQTIAVAVSSSLQNKQQQQQQKWITKPESLYNN